MTMKVSDECLACVHHLGGECRATSGKPEYGDCGHYEGCTGFVPRRDETVRDVCAECEVFNAYERFKAVKDAEIARLKAALLTISTDDKTAEGLREIAIDACNGKEAAQ